MTDEYSMADAYDAARERTADKTVSQWITDIPTDTQDRLLEKDQEEQLSAIAVTETLISAGMYSSFADRVLELAQIVRAARQAAKTAARVRVEEEQKSVRKPVKADVKSNGKTVTERNARQQYYDRLIAENRCVNCAAPHAARYDKRVCKICLIKQRAASKARYYKQKVAAMPDNTAKNN